MGKSNIKRSYPAVFLDRDGTVIHDKNYLGDPDKVILYKHSANCINKLRKAGFKIIIITNQSGVARKMFGEKEVKAVNKRVLELLKKQDAKIDGLYYCPHGDEDKCNCRKPKIGMALKAAKEHNIDLKRSYTVGDSVRDYIFGNNSGGKGVLVLTGHGKKQQKKVRDQKIKPLAVCKSIKQATELITNDFKKSGNL